MSSRRSSSGLCGVLAIDKPCGMTSHDVIDKVRKITGERRVGHAGTLDPMATGLLLVGVGAACRLSEYLTGHDKEYDARIVFGVSTDTDDSMGRPLKVCDEAALQEALENADAASVLARFMGEQDQLPPAYSAIKKNGTTAYKAAREGKCIELEPRRITVHGAELIAAGEGECAIEGPDMAMVATLPYWDVHFHVSKGTYIRALARDIGSYMGCGAHLGSLRRTSISRLGVEDACTLEELSHVIEHGQKIPWCDPARLLGFPVVELEEQQAECVENGRELTGVGTAGNGLVSCVKNDRLLAVYGWKKGACRPATVIPGGVVGVG